VLVLAVAAAWAVQGSTIKVLPEALCPGRIDPMQCGQFIEYLCDLVPGMWAEKLYDGHFVGLSPYKVRFIEGKDFKEQAWYPSGAVNRARYSRSDDGPSAGQGSRLIEIGTGAKATAGLSQDGIAVDPKDPCHFHIWLKEEGTRSPVDVRLSDGTVKLAQARLSPTDVWARYDAQLAPEARSKSSALTISFTGPGRLCLQSASLMPASSVHGWRRDVFERLKDLKPGVIRFGGSALDDPGLGDFEWKATIGDPDLRRPFPAWGGLQQAGAGLEEIVQLCEMVEAEPLICVRTRDRSAKDAADEVEYFNGAATTPMGSLRARNGHPKPYGIKFWQIGNEQAGEEYDRKLAEFGAAMKNADPSIQLFSSYPTEGVLKGSGKLLSYVCPHHYDAEDLAGEQRDLDEARAMIRRLAPGSPIRVAVTEWNTTGGDFGLGRARLWGLQNALACARYQNLLHRNADLVRIANRSNLTNSFCSGIIQTDSSDLYVSPTYWVQLLYSRHAGTRPLRIDPPAPLGEGLDASATLSEDGSKLTLFVVNRSPDLVEKTLDLSAMGRIAHDAQVWVLADRQGAGEPDVTNSFEHPDRVSPVKQDLAAGPTARYDFRPYSLTVLVFERAAGRS
jgi:alpha-L-arabinofuranosidase